MDVKRIVVCGDSFCSASRTDQLHFSCILSNHGFEVTNLARGGISNFAICFQLQQALALTPDLIIYRVTGPDRLDIPIRDFIPSLQLKNFLYPFSCDASASSQYIGNSVTGTILSDTITGFLREQRQNRLPKNLRLSEETLNAIKNYLTYLHDDKLQTVKDSWMIGYWENEIAKNNVQSIKITSDGIGKEIYEYVEHNPDKLEQAVYHTDAKTQEAVAKSILDRIQSWK